MKFIVNGQYVGKKTAIEWPQAGMKKGADKKWLDEFEKAISPHRTDLKNLYLCGKPLEVKVTVSGKPQSIKLLDIHDALANIINKFTDLLFPRTKGKSIPQVQDRLIWKCVARKVVGQPKTEFEIQEFT